jgi:hypothetical protein
MCRAASDHATVSNFDAIQVEHIDLDRTVDWQLHVLGGSVARSLFESTIPVGGSVHTPDIMEHVP